MAESKGLASKVAKVEPKKVNAIDPKKSGTIREKMKTKDTAKAKQVAIMAKEIQGKKDELEALTKESYSILMPRTEIIAYLEEISSNITARGECTKEMEVANSKVKLAIQLLGKATDK